MDKEVWASVSNTDHKISEDHNLEELTKALFSYLGSTDPERGYRIVTYADAPE